MVNTDFIKLRLSDDSVRFWFEKEEQKTKQNVIKFSFDWLSVRTTK